jgi:very-short-patch-repair endonuclease
MKGVVLMENGSVDNSKILYCCYSFPQKEYLKSNGIRYELGGKSLSTDCPFWVLESTLLHGVGCLCCCENPLIVVEGINDIPTVAPWMIKYFQGAIDEAKMYTCQSNKRILIKCPNCGAIKKYQINNIYNRHDIGCICGDGYSYGHKYTFNLLTQLNQNFIDNHTFDWCKFYNPFKQKEVSGEYDFVIENKKLIIEVDGGFHRTDNNMNGQTKEESKFLDDEKDRLVKEYGYEVIRISDEGNFKENTIAKLQNIFNFNNVNWVECEKFALSNRVKEACDYWNSGVHSTKEIGKIMKISSKTILDYLKRGAEICWCDYNSRYKEKPIINLDDGRVYTSSTNCEKLSIKYYGIKLTQSKISSVCTGKRLTHHGYHFKFISDLTTEEYIKYDIENKLKELNRKD